MILKIMIMRNLSKNQQVYLTANTPNAPMSSSFEKALPVSFASGQSTTTPLNLIFSTKEEKRSQLSIHVIDLTLILPTSNHFACYYHPTNLFLQFKNT